MDATTVAVDLAQTVFEVAVANAQWRIVARHRFSRTQFRRFLATTAPTHVVMEACGSAHFWGRTAQQIGHTVSLLPARYVRPYVRRNKTDRADAEAILEAVRSGQLPTVAVKRIEQQALVGLHRVREQWMTTRTARINVLRGLLREHGIVLPAGPRASLAALPSVLADSVTPLPAHLRRALQLLADEIHALETAVAAVERDLATYAQQDPVAVRLREIPGIGLLTATALVGTVGHIHAFRRARQFASWLGLTPREYSSGAQRRLGGISKRGDRYLRLLLTHGARAVLSGARRRAAHAPPRALDRWALAIEARRGHNKATSAVANKLSRIVWAVWHRDVPFTATLVA